MWFRPQRTIPLKETLRGRKKVKWRRRNQITLVQYRGIQNGKKRLAESQGKDKLTGRGKPEVDLMGMGDFDRRDGSAITFGFDSLNVGKLVSSIISIEPMVLEMFNDERSNFSFLIEVRGATMSTQQGSKEVFIELSFH